MSREELEADVLFEYQWQCELLFPLDGMIVQDNALVLADAYVLVCVNFGGTIS